MYPTRRLGAVAGSLALALGLAACGGPSASGGGAASGTAKNYTFELITKSNSSPYWLAVEAGAEAAAKKLGVTVHFEGPAQSSDLQSQISMVQNAITAHVDGILLAAQNPKALLNPVRSAIQAKIPVVTVDSGLEPNISNSYIATDNVAAAKKLAGYIAKLAGGKGTYAIVDQNQTSTSGIQRPQGFTMGLQAGGNFTSAGMQISNESIATGRAETANILTSHPNITVMFGANDRAAIGVAEGVKSVGREGKVIVAGFDADTGEVNLIKTGAIAASLLQSPYQMGYQGVSELIQIKHGKSVPKLVATPTFILTAKNFSTPQAVTAIQQYIPSYRG